MLNITLIIAAVFLLYGYAARLFNILFFWESVSIGWNLMLIAAIIFLLLRIKSNKARQRKTILQYLAIAGIAFAFIVETFLLAFLPRTDAYKAAKEYLITKYTAGRQPGLSLQPIGGIQISSSEKGEMGAADLSFIVKQTNRYRIVNVIVYKEDFTLPWRVIEQD